jgi:HAMP domain-containing protein
MSKLQESANSRYLAAIRELARVRKVQAGTPAVQVNTQVNILGA